MSSFINKKSKSVNSRPRKSPKPQREEQKEEKKTIIRKPQRKQQLVPESILGDVIERDVPAVQPLSRVSQEHSDSESEEEDIKQLMTKEGSVESVTFSFMSEQEIKKYAVTQVTETKFTGPNSVGDLRMGVINKNDVCETCEGGWEECCGHFGYIQLDTKIPHPLRVKNVLEYLKLFCKNCYRLVVTTEKIKLLGLHKLTGESRYKKILNEAEKHVSVCPHCESVLPEYTCFDDKYTFQIKKQKMHLSYESIATIFSNVCNDDVELLGYDLNYVHPSRLIIGCLLVAPPCVRPFVTTPDGHSCEDDLTWKYVEVIKANNKVRYSPNEKSRQDEIDKLYFHIRTLFDNNKGKARDNGGKRPIKCIKKRLSSKQGRIRQNILGKRVDYCARTVIGGDATCLVDELIVPEEIAKDLTYPVNVSQFNIEKCQQLIDNGKVNYVIRDGKTINAKIATRGKEFKFQFDDMVKRDGKLYNLDSYKEIKGKDFQFQAGDTIIRKEKVFREEGIVIVKKEIKDIPIPKRKRYELKVGDTIERQLQNGDIGVFNRQPTLWKGSMRAKRVRILPGKTFRLSLASTAAFNADFDKIIS